MQHSVDHILTVIAVDDLSAAVAFYGIAFGWVVTVDTSVYVEFELPRGQRFGVYDRNGFAKNTGVLPSPCPPGGTTGTEVYLYCADIDDAIARVISAGAHQLAALAPRLWGDDAAYFADLDGNVLVLARPSDPVG